MRTRLIFPWFEQAVSLEGAFTHGHGCCQGQKGWKLVLTAGYNESRVQNTGVCYQWVMSFWNFVFDLLKLMC